MSSGDMSMKIPLVIICTLLESEGKHNSYTVLNLMSYSKEWLGKSDLLVI